ncbi:hypothetical protein [Rhizobium sp. CSW-27]|uniref:hypothetical protein n=1 Tax=Rhizobium sp. CSW-27 TaxID=2839985 RepID=UPI001C018392|nr:hypothetical protein [Rhizobium sp. CSW-27]MBT9372526.1 hypothetical protein [Rhizobium sp. CSW-27]
MSVFAMLLAKGILNARIARKIMSRQRTIIVRNSACHAVGAVLTLNWRMERS